MDPPWSNAMPPGSGVLRWFKTLQVNGYLWEASRVLRVLLPVLPMLPSHNVASLIFIEQNRQQEQRERAPAQADQSERGESDRWAHLAMNLSKAQSLLDTIIREYSPSPESRFGHEILYARGQDYLNKACKQALDESNQMGKPDQTRRPNLEVALEQRDYSLIGKNIHLGAPSLEFQKLVVSGKDYRLHILKAVRELLHHPDDIQSIDWQNAIDGILKCQAESGDHVGFIRVWEFFATIVLSSLGQLKYDKPAKPLLASVRDSFQLHIMDTLKPQRTAAGKPIRSSLELLSETTRDICKYQFAETLSYNRASEKEDYPMQFDIPLCLWAFMQKKEHLSLNNLLLEGSDPGNDYPTRKIDMDAVKSCLPNFVKDSNQLGRRAGDKSETTNVGLGDSVRVDGNIIITGNSNVSISGDVRILGDLIIDGALVQPSTDVVETASVDKGKGIELERLRSKTAEKREIPLPKPHKDGSITTRKHDLPLTNPPKVAAADLFLKKLGELNEILAPREVDTDKSQEPVKIALLDIGISPDHRQPFQIEYRSFIENGEPANNDDIEHGTNLLHLILKVFDRAKFYVAEVIRETMSDENTPTYIANAISWAVDNRVDIISIPAGLDMSSGRLQKEVERASSADILIFTAATNHSSTSTEAYPARMHDDVFYMFSTDGLLEVSSYNPPPSRLVNNFAILGEDVTVNPGEPPVSGTSVSTAIATGVAAMVLDFAKHAIAREIFGERDLERIRTNEGMAKIFELMSKNHKDDRYECLAPWDLLLPHHAAQDRQVTRRQLCLKIVTTLRRD